MSKAETAFAACILAFGAFLLEESLKLPFFVLEVPGPGFLPLLLALAIIALGGTLTVQAFRSRLAAAEGVIWPDAAGWRRLAVAGVPLIAYLFVLDALGFFLTCVIYLVVVAYGLGVRTWRVLLFVPLGTTLVLHMVFSIWLKVPLPKGILSSLIY
jgi:putative tricarboxylic transport membrane protein